MCNNGIRYKDDIPENTIKRIKNIFNNIGLDVHLKTKKNSVFDVYHTEVFFDDISVYLGGKGKTQEYSEASALAETIERLQSRCWWNEKTSLHNYKYFPDEIDFSYSFEDLPKSFIDDIYTHFTKFSSVNISKKDIKNICLDFFPNIKSIPFYSYKDKKLEYIPFDILQDIVGSNGLASGNSLEEATVQAICELLERYCMIECIMKDLTPPEVPLNYLLNKYPDLVFINKKLILNNYDIRVFDASLGLGIPCLCVVFIDKTTHKYNVKFGCHPVFQIALERCFTEMFEGFEDIDTFINEKCHHILDCINISYKSFKNYNMLVCSNKNIIGNSFFDLKKSWEFKEWTDFDYYDNSLGCKFLIDICLNKFGNIYFRNNGFLGFPTVHVYIPGISFCKFYPYDIRMKYHKCIGYAKNFKNFSSYTKDIIVDIIKFLENNISFYHRESKHIVDGEEIIISDETIISLLYLQIEELENAYLCLKEKENKTEFDMALLLKIYLLLNKKCISDIEKQISLFFSYKISKIINNENIISYIFDKHNYDLKGYDNKSIIINNLKNKMLEFNNINQYVFESL